MDKARLYAESNGLQKRDAFFVLKNYFHLIKWRNDGGDCIMDVGCGSGDFTAYLASNKVPPTTKWLLGVDVSEKMVQFARDNHSQPKLQFQQLNIVEPLRNDLLEQFDHILSFYCMHWIQNQKLAFQNVYDLLRPNGDIFMLFLANNPIFEIYEIIARMPKWKSYMKDVAKYISPYQHSQRPDEELGHLLEEIHFVDITCKVHSRSYYFDDMNVWRKTILSINPFIDRIPVPMRNEYIDEYINQIKQLNLFEENNNGQRIFFEYNLLVVYARKN